MVTLRASLCLAFLSLSACALSHEAFVHPTPGHPDGGLEADASTCGAPPMLVCFSGCDSGPAPVCTPSGWQCPPGSSTTRPSDCCVGPAPRPFDCACVFGEWRCEGPDAGHDCGDLWEPTCWTSCMSTTSPVCVSPNWVCPPGSSMEPPECTIELDAGMPFACPSDPTALIGTPCDASLAGQTCGTCADPCGLCDLVACDGSTWTAPARPGPYCGDRFFCGAITCQRSTEVCDVFLSDVAGEPDVYRCAPYPTGCDPAGGCACWGATDPLCTYDGDGGVTVRFPGG